MSEALLLGDDSSQTSQRSALSGSLLERIRAARGEAQQQQQQPSSSSLPASVPPPSAAATTTTVTPAPVSLEPPSPPSYNPTAVTNESSATAVDNSANNTGRWAAFNVSWPHALSVGGRGRRHQQEGDDDMMHNDASEALLSPSTTTTTTMTDDDGSYSMGRYFRTFVMDFYNLFTSMPPVVQGIVVVVLLYIAIKLL